MKKQNLILAASALALFGQVAMAQSLTTTSGDGSAPTSDISRDAVRQDVLSARQAGELIPAGQGPIDNTPRVRRSALTRAEVRTQVAQARAAGQLIPAGQGPIDFNRTSGYLLTRAEVKAETLQARANGELVPAGEGFVDPVRVAHHRAAGGYPVAFHQQQPAIRSN